MLGDIIIGIAVGLIGYGSFLLVHGYINAPLLDEVFPIEDRPTTRGGKDRAVPVQARHLSEKNEITFHDGDR